MCKGTSTKMACGHVLHHYIKRCQPACDTVDGPMQTLNDTCANCHPSMITQEINRRHDALRAMLMRQLRDARSKEQAAAVEHALAEQHAERGKELRAVSRVRWNGRVNWGGDVDEHDFL